MNPEQLSYELRETTPPDLARRRVIVGLSFFGAAIGGIVSLFQIGMIKRLPDPPIEILDSARVDPPITPASVSIFPMAS